MEYDNIVIQKVENGYILTLQRTTQGLLSTTEDKEHYVMKEKGEVQKYVGELISKLRKKSANEPQECEDKY